MENRNGAGYRAGIIDVADYYDAVALLKFTLPPEHRVAAIAETEFFYVSCLVEGPDLPIVSGETPPSVMLCMSVDILSKPGRVRTIAYFQEPGGTAGRMWEVAEFEDLESYYAATDRLIRTT